MKNGYLKVGVITQKVKIGDVSYNAECIITAVENASNMGIKLLSMPELCLCGVSSGDLFTMRNFISKARCAIIEIADKTKALDTVFVFGAPIEVCGLLYDCAIIVYKGEILGIVPKKSMANYNENYDSRWFSSYDGENTFVDFDGKKVLFGNKIIFKNSKMGDFSFVCNVGQEYSAMNYALNGATIIVNLGAHAEVIGSKEYYKMLAISDSAKTVSACLYANAGSGESTTDVVYSGHNLIAENGKILSESEIFNNGLISTEIDVDFLQRERSKIFNGK